MSKCRCGRGYAMEGSDWCSIECECDDFRARTSKLVAQLEQVTKDFQEARQLAGYYRMLSETFSGEITTLTKSLEIAKGYLKQHADMGCQLAVDKLDAIAALESKPSPDAGEEASVPRCSHRRSDYNATEAWCLDCGGRWEVSKIISEFLNAPSVDGQEGKNGG